MYRIRFHGRGGQGMKTASRILGNAFFQEGFDVQDAPRYGAERRGAPIFAYVRAAKTEIYERGIIQHPDLVVVADETLVAITAAGVLTGITDRTVILINTSEPPEVWQDRLNINSRIITLPIADIDDRMKLRFIGSTSAGAAARLIKVTSRESIEKAIKDELSSMASDVIETNLKKALSAYDQMADYAGIVAEGDAVAVEGYLSPEWIDMPFEPAHISAPIVFDGATSVEVRTGLWRTLRPIIDYDKCKHCWWVCSTFCPDSAIDVKEGIPEIDYDHCKGCMICVAQCPSHAIQAIPEQVAQAQEKETHDPAIDHR